MSIEYGKDTKLLGLLGDPLGHSIVPRLHNGLYQFGGINAVLLPMELKDGPGALDRFFSAVQTLHIRGFIVTMPYKTRMLPYMDEAEDVCRIFNCVNAVRYENGKFFGAAFDGYGMCQSLEDAGCILSGREALILGAGGISGPVAGEMAKRGVRRITILNRTPEKAQRLAAILQEHTGVSVHAGVLDESQLNQAAAHADIVAQCTSIGMAGTLSAFPDLGFLEKLRPDSAVIDAVYNPPQTALLAAAARRGLLALNGTGMLSNQANRLLRFFFDRDLGADGKAEAVRLIRQQIASP